MLEEIIEEILDKFKKRMMRLYNLEIAYIIIVCAVSYGIFLFYTWKSIVKVDRILWG